MSPRGPVVIFGGAGFIGTNLASRLLDQKVPVRIFDSLARPGVETNLEFLQSRYGAGLEFHKADIRDREAVRRAVDGASFVCHFAAQVAVTTSVSDPVTDFEVNAGGTVNVLEALRSQTDPAPLLYTSTNKVYGNLLAVGMRAAGTRYEPVDAEICRRGIDEETPLSFHSPYGCSKGAAEQYVLDYSRSYGLQTCVFRMSCIYGFHQCGSEDQGWVAHFLMRALRGEPITIFGDGLQVRDILFASDLVDAMLLARNHMSSLSGQAFNIGGGPSNAVSLLEVLSLLESVTGLQPAVSFQASRIGDQLYYVSNCSRFEAATGWRPKVRAREGVTQLTEWLDETFSNAAKSALLVRGGAS